ncbi:uncharacterized protein V1518DRAFT_425864 [Limtongia smithiae]|uniref:uncharacterized protein n=1 Tax=Limtongia smithiae TaxID=1125753 RepID=UPI0034CE5BC8
MNPADDGDDLPPERGVEDFKRQSNPRPAQMGPPRRESMSQGPQRVSTATPAQFAITQNGPVTYSAPRRTSTASVAPPHFASAVPPQQQQPLRRYDTMSRPFASPAPGPQGQYVQPMQQQQMQYGQSGQQISYPQQAQQIPYAQQQYIQQQAPQVVQQQPYQQQYHRSPDFRPQSNFAPPPPPPPNLNFSQDSLRRVFEKFDTDGSGFLSQNELQIALQNCFHQRLFNMRTVRLMMGMFDDDKSQTIDFNEFEKLHGFLESYRTAFQNSDIDNSGSISFDEFSITMQSFNLNVGRDEYGFRRALFRHYCVNDEIDFDNFVQVCCTLHLLHSAFERHYVEPDRRIHISEAEYISDIIDFVTRFE